jgi:ASC-1-like (ASCH) protein
MRKITIVVPDDKLALIERLVEAVPGMEIVEVEDMDSLEEFQRKSPMERLDFAIRSIDSEEGLLANRYDFAWLYAAIQHKLLKGVEAFHSVESFRRHLNNIGIKNIPSNSTISCWYGNLRHQYPDWVFSNCDATERQRRINVAKRFLSLFNKGK